MYIDGDSLKKRKEIMIITKVRAVVTSIGRKVIVIRMGTQTVGGGRGSFFCVGQVVP